MKRRILSLLLVMTMILSMVPATAFAAEEPTYVAEIGETKYTDLHEAMTAAKAGETVKLLADVDLAGTEWEPVSFKGAFDGQGKTISNLTINKPGVSNTGFITSLNGTFENVTFTDPTVTGGECTGIVAGRAGGSAALAKNITVNGTIKVETTHSGYARVGAIVGGWAYGNYEYITVDGGDSAVSYIKHTGGGDGRYVAGIVGHADDVDSYKNCVVKNITISSENGGWLCGGIAGPGPSDGLASGCSVENVKINADYSGGMFGWYYGDGTIENSSVKDVEFTAGSTNNGAIGGYSNNTEATVTNVTVENVKNSNGEPRLDEVVEVDGVYYTDLQVAIDVADGKTVTLLRDVEISQTIKIEADETITLELNGKDIDGTENCNIALMSYGNLTIQDSSEGETGSIRAGKTAGKTGNTINICAGSFELKSGEIYSVNNAILVDEEAAEITISGGKVTADENTNNSAALYVSSEEDTVVVITDGELSGYNGILLWNNTTIEMSGGSVNGIGATGIQGNGSHDNTSISLSGDATVAGGVAGIYHPQGGDLSISENASVTGLTGIVMKGGNLTITGGTITGTEATATEYRYISSGYMTTGDALQVESVGDAYGPVTVEIAGGTFVSTAGKAVGSYNANGGTRVTEFISGGTFSSDIGELCAEGFESKWNEEEEAYGVYSESVAFIDKNKNGVQDDDETGYTTFADALNAVGENEIIVLMNAYESEVSDEIDFDKKITFTITGKAPKYALPVITFQNATVNIEDAEILIPELDARQNATINVIDSIVNDVGGNSIVKSYYNGVINISGTSVVHTMQVTTMGRIIISGEAELNATWQTNVYGNGLIEIKDDAVFNTAALHLTGQDYSDRDNTDEDRVGKPANIVVDGATFTIGKVLSSNGADYSYNSSKGINIGTVDGKNAVLDIKNGAIVNIWMADGETVNIGAGGSVNVNDSSFTMDCRKEDGTVSLTNNGTITVAGTSDIAANVTGSGWVYMNGVTMSDKTNLIGAKVRFASGTNSIDGSVIDDGFFQVGIGAYKGTDTNVDTINGVVVNVKNAKIGANGSTYAGWIGTGFYDTDAEKAEVMTDAKYVLNIENSVAEFGYLHISNDGELNVNGDASEKAHYNNSDYSFYAGDFIINGVANFDDTDVLALYTKVSCDNGTEKPGTLNIVNGTEYEAERHNGAIDGTNFTLYKVGIVNVEEANLHIGEYTSIAEKAVMNIGGTATALGTITNNGTINLTTADATLTTPQRPEVKTTLKYGTVVYEEGAYKVDVEKFTVTFINGEEETTMSAIKGDKITKPVDPTREGWIFEGWFADESYENEYDFTAEVLGDVTLYAKWNVLVTVTFEANGGSEVEAVEVASGAAISAPQAPTREGYTFDGWFSDADCTVEYDFETPVTGDITLYAKWTENSTGGGSGNQGGSGGGSSSAEPDVTEPNNPFIDVDESDYFYDAVMWAVSNGVTSGTSANTFSPDMTCTRAQTVTFLWNAAGKPEPTMTECPFVDVAPTAYYYKAVLWAVEEGITVGTSETTFSPDQTVTRGQNVTFLWKFADKPVVEEDSKFVDVTEANYYHDAVVWAAEEGITSGTSATTFGPEHPCTRAQIVTFLYRHMAE